MERQNITPLIQVKALLQGDGFSSTIGWACQGEGRWWAGLGPASTMV
jgi:hypothetical protein